MKSVLIVGVGRFGRHMAEKLNELGHQVMVVDSDEQRVKQALPYASRGLIGDTTSPDFMGSLGINDYDLCVVAIGDDFQSSLETTLLLKELGAKKVVARAARGVHAKFLLRNGADEVVYPEKELAQWSAIRYSSDHIFDYIKIDDDNSVFEIDIPQKWLGKSLTQLDIRHKYQMNVIGIRTQGHLTLDVDPNVKLHADLRLLVTGTTQTLKKIFHEK
ncbi:trk system potassium uptake protein TrkA [Ligilactobacillus sp. WC1T17]|uniref:Trk system potassium uptake protein TrkA n=1 Tax=Ligilactobacillus ruminis TaxID=1623 RepID=A0ABY1A9V3_9LACO|nr:trk system potassium uptake protein TrkA [Ligilactobacillus ruminis]